MAQATTTTTTQAPPIPGEFCWFELNTRNVEGVKKFYGELLGWTITASETSGFTYHHWLRDGVMFGGIMDMNSPEWGEIPSHWMSYVRVDDVDHCVADVSLLGGKVCVPPTDIPTVGRFSVVTDPTGGTLSLIRLDAPKPIAPAVSWTELMTRDASRAATFYTRLLGWQTESMPMGESGDYTLCKQGEKLMGGIFQMAGPGFEGVPPHWLNYLHTKDVDRDAKRLQTLGGKLLVPPTDIPNNIGRFCIFTDPGDGHAALYQPSAPA